MNEICITADDGREFCISTANGELEVQEQSPDESSFYYYDPEASDLRLGLEVVFDHLGIERLPCRCCGVQE